MTVLDEKSRPAPAGRREEHRKELADLVGRDPARMPDSALLVDDLALDSLAMMSVLVWLDSHGVHVDADGNRRVRVGDVLSLLDRAGTPGVSIRVVDGPRLGIGGPADVTVQPPTPADPLVPRLAGHGFRLTPVEPGDVGFLYALATQPATGFRWRYRGAPPPFDRFAADLWKQVLVQYVARNGDGEPVGHLVAYSADPYMHYAYLGAVFEPRYAGLGMGAHAVALFARHLFHTFPLRKIYLEIPGYNWAQVRSGEERLFHVEGVLRDHCYYAGRYWDQYVCAIYPEGAS
jgi:RimJ/RimL family protein N-acetyltransferase